MKIFGIEFFKKDITHEKEVLLLDFLSTLSLSQQKALFNKIISRQNDNIYYVLRDSETRFNNENLSSIMNDFFNTFKLFRFVTNYYIIELSSKYISLDDEHITIGGGGFIENGKFESYYNVYMRINGINVYENNHDMAGQDCGEEEILEQTIYFYILKDLLYMLEKESTIEELEENIKNKYLINCV